MLADRYRTLAAALERDADEPHKAQLRLMQHTLAKVPAEGAQTLYEAIQSFILLWQVMCVEQAPNPFAFSVGTPPDSVSSKILGRFSHVLVVLPLSCPMISGSPRPTDARRARCSITA